MKNSQPIVVIGAGISGLATAWFLQRANHNVLLLEKNKYPGGTMQSISQEGYVIDLGPNSALETTPLFDTILTELGIKSQQVYANRNSSKRYILRNGKLHPLPMTPQAVLATRLWSFRGKLRLLGELFAGRADHEESIAEFVNRRLGQEFLDYAIDPFVAGVYAGNPEQLSVRVAFPKLYALEEKYGGLIKGTIKGARERKRRAEKAKATAQMFSFIQGMNTFPAAIAEALGKRVKYNSSVIAVSPSRRRRRNKTWNVVYESRNAKESVEASAVIIAAPAYATSSIIREIDPACADALSRIYYPPVAMVFTGFPLRQIRQQLDGFGYLVPSKESRSILGTIWSSAIFPNRAPEGYAAFTTFVGGSRQPEMVELADDQLLDHVISDLRSIMNIQGDPSFTLIQRWEKAIPQYNLGYGEILKQLDLFEQNHKGLFFCSNYRGGIAVGDCLISAEKTAQKVEEHLTRQ